MCDVPKNNTLTHSRKLTGPTPLCDLTLSWWRGLYVQIVQGLNMLGGVGGGVMPLGRVSQGKQQLGEELD